VLPLLPLTLLNPSHPPSFRWIELSLTDYVQNLLAENKMADAAPRGRGGFGRGRGGDRGRGGRRGPRRGGRKDDEKEWYGSLAISSVVISHCRSRVGSPSPSSAVS
jgi:hypothetical protein